MKFEEEKKLCIDFINKPSKMEQQFEIIYKKKLIFTPNQRPTVIFPYRTLEIIILYQQIIYFSLSVV